MFTLTAIASAIRINWLVLEMLIEEEEEDYKHP